MRPLALLLVSLVLLTAGCGLWPSPTPDVEAGSLLAEPECRAETYLFAGIGTLADLGLVGQSLAPLPDPERPAKIWVTEDRVLCFEFDDGSGGTDWPIDAAWLPPGSIQDDGATAGLPIQVIGFIAVAVALIVLSVLAFRRAK